MKRPWLAAILIIAAVWFGMLLGVSFLATPAKFLALSLPLPVALDVGRHTFAVFSKVEWLLSAVLLGTVLAGDRTWPSVSVAAVAILLVAAETIWLLPLLDQRVGMIIAGERPAPSNLHNLYIAFELAKLLALSFVVLVMARKLAGSPSNLHSDESAAR
ncbi:MAG: DUF4149 domain-containing protein [Rhizobiales bacterium]|nr:DUF4149 domain-containing protein [Hyphomicrobiales bacterium]